MPPARMWAAEFGQNTWDELNRIDRGGNYGWPVVEGVSGDTRFIEPVIQWSTGDASPSGLAIVGDTLFLAALRGERLWSIAPATAGGAIGATPWFIGELGDCATPCPVPTATCGSSATTPTVAARHATATTGSTG